MTANTNLGPPITFSFIVFVVVFIVIEPHMMDVKPPMHVRVLLAPTLILAPVVIRFLPHGNIGSAEHPIIEGTPLDFLAGEMLIVWNVLLYPIFTFVLITLLSKFLKRP